MRGKVLLIPEGCQTGCACYGLSARWLLFPHLPRLPHMILFFWFQILRENLGTAISTGMRGHCASVMVKCTLVVLQKMCLRPTLQTTIMARHIRVSTYLCLMI